MMKRCVLPALLAMLLPAIAAADPGTKSPPLPAGFDPAAIDAYVAGQVAEKEIVGLSLALVRNGKIELSKGYGKASLATGTPVTQETVFAVGSVTKQFTAAAVLLLAQDGKLSVSDKVAKYFPRLTRAGDITLLDLMNHVSGYPDYYPLDFVDRRMKIPIEVDELIRQYATGKLDFEPGTGWSYSNTGFVILGRVVEIVSGMSMREFLDARVFRPLGMDRTVFEPTSVLSGAASGHARYALGPLVVVPLEAKGWLEGAGGLRSTALDLARWDLGLLDGQLLHEEQYRIMTTPRSLADGRIKDYGCGIAVRRNNGHLILTHSGAVSGFQAHNTLIPDTKSAVILLANQEETTPVNTIESVLLSLLLPKAPEPPQVSGPAATDAAKAFFLDLQKGRINRSQLGVEFSLFLDPDKLKTASARLKPCGKPLKVELAGLSERGGMEVATVKLSFKTGVLKTLMYRSPDGIIQEFLVGP